MITNPMQVKKQIKVNAYHSYLDKNDMQHNYKVSSVFSTFSESLVTSSKVLYFLVLYSIKLQLYNLVDLFLFLLC